jgi:surfactin synthase thioesterase subunit
MISEEISDCADGPYTIFGHSMGALLTYEVAAQLESAGRPRPFRVFLSGALPPYLARDRRIVSDSAQCMTSEGDMLLWKGATMGAFESRRYAGDHFFFTDPNGMWSVFDTPRKWQGKQRMSMAGAGVHNA